MPRCQRTFQRLGPGDIAPGSGGAACWTCLFCDDAEVYKTVHAPDLLEYARLAEAECIRDFGRPRDADRPTLLLLGLRPECVLEPSDRRYDVYLRRDSDPCQLRLQIGHEIFHRVCSRGRIFHWTHEMLACLVSVRLLRRYGSADYADTMERAYATQSEMLSFDLLRNADLWQGSTVYPTGFYGRAYVTGAALVEAAGWESVTRLTRCSGRDETPDIADWVEKIPSASARAECARILGITSGKR